MNDTQGSFKNPIGVLAPGDPYLKKERRKREVTGRKGINS